MVQNKPFDLFLGVHISGNTVEGLFTLARIQAICSRLITVHRYISGGRQELYACLSTVLEPRQFKNNLTMFESKLILKLPPFSLTALTQCSA